MEAKQKQEEKIEEATRISKERIVSPPKDFTNDRVISECDMKFFEDNGYLIIRNAVPDAMCDDVVNSIYKFGNMNPNRPEDWYRPPIAPNGFVEMYHQQSMWNTRQHPRVYKAFTELWSTNKLWVSIDRVCMKLPCDSNYKNYNHHGFVHWDMDPWKPKLPFGLQGVLALEDTDEDQGGFHCVPGMHKYIEEWIKKFPEPEQCEKFHTRGIPINVPKRQLEKLKLKRIPAKKGDLIIWRREIAHGNGQNSSRKPRLAQYINMYPARDDDMVRLPPQESLHPERRFERLQMFDAKLCPFTKPGNAKYDESLDKSELKLSELGKKLLGQELWE